MISGALIFKSAAKGAASIRFLTMASNADARGVAESVLQMSETLSHRQRNAAEQRFTDAGITEAARERARLNEGRVCMRAPCMILDTS